MTPGQRRWIFLAAVAGLAAFYVWGLAGLPGFGNYPGPYGDIINRIAVAQTNATGVVSAVNFEYRGFDTVGEEFILFVAATAMAVVLRHLRHEREEDSPGATGDWAVPPASDSVRLVALIFTGPVVVMGWFLAPGPGLWAVPGPVFVLVLVLIPVPCLSGCLPQTMVKAAPTGQRFNHIREMFLNWADGYSYA